MSTLLYAGAILNSNLMSQPKISNTTLHITFHSDDSKNVACACLLPALFVPDSNSNNSQKYPTANTIFMVNCTIQEILLSI